MDPGLLQIYAIASPSISVDTLEKEVWEEVENLRRQTALGRRDGESEKTGPGLLPPGSCKPSSSKGCWPDSIKYRAGDFRLIYTLLDRYESVTAEDVLRVARKYLRPENRTVITLQPVTQKEHEDLGEVE